MHATAPSTKSLSNVRPDHKDETIAVTSSDGCFRSKSCHPLRVVRQYINPAVYVESSICNMAPFRRSPVLLNYASDDEAIQSNKMVRVKRCSCFSNPNSCPCHPIQQQDSIEPTYRNDIENEDVEDLLEDQLDCRLDAGDQDFNNEYPLSTVADDNNAFTNYSDSDSKITVKQQYEDELKLSLVSTSSFTLRYYADDKEKEQAFKNWCARKDQERKLQDEKNALMREIKQKEKELQLQQERENFKRWLLKKKKDELKKQRDTEKAKAEEQQKLEEKEKRLAENDLRFRLWLKKKEETKLERKIKDQMKVMKTEREKQQRTENNEKAYQQWLVSSKNKPKPIPLNRGLQSLRSSVSVTYVNPTPWVPNIDTNSKPSSQ